MNKKIVLVLLYFVFGLTSLLFSQESNVQLGPVNKDTLIDNGNIITRNFVGFVPSKFDHINGWAIGYLYLSDDMVKKNKIKKINGIYTNLSPFQIISGVHVSLFTLSSILGRDVGVETKNHSIYGIYTGHDTTTYNQLLNGISVSIADNGSETKINGLEISLISQKSYQINGFSFSGLYNFKNYFTGMMVGLINLSEKGVGLQIGLINNCADLRGLQIGLINRNGHRISPIINFRLKK